MITNTIRRALVAWESFSYEFGVRCRSKYWSVLLATKKLRVYGRIHVYYPERIIFGNAGTLNEGVILNGRGGITIGDNVRISAYVAIHTSALDFQASRSSREHTHAKVIIEDGVWIGSGAIINPGVTIGRDAFIGPGSVVTRDVPAHAVVATSPVRMGEYRKRD